jgi:hypothetical protein
VADEAVLNNVHKRKKSVLKKVHKKKKIQKSPYLDVFFQPFSALLFDNQVQSFCLICGIPDQF